MTNQNASSTSARRGATGGADRGPRPVKWVSFVGSGPGDPGLLTVRALELLREAEIVITETDDHEQLVRSVLGLPAPVETEGDGEPAEQVGPVFVDGGFGEDGQPLTHASRAKVVVRQAKTGKRVVRLMSGDPFLYASGPEEALACTKAEVGFEIVPGVSSITAVPAYAGIPLTTKNHREVAVVTCSDARIDWEAYATHPTLVLLSAVRSIGDIAAELISAGRAGDTPVSMTRTGTLTTQQTIVSTLADIAADARAAKMTPPAITVVGPVVDLRETLSWFETKPLFGWRVLVPRTKEQAGALSSRLRGFGAVPEEVPTISVEPPRNPQQMDKAVRGLVEGRYEWIAFTSVNAVRAVREKFEEYGLDARAFSGPEDRGRRRQDRHRARPLGPEGRPGPLGRAVRPWAAGGLAAVRRPARPDQPGVPAARRHRHRDARGRPGGPRLGGRRRHGLPHRARGPAAGTRPARRSSRAGSTRWCSPRPRPCATWSASPASRTPRR